MPTEVEQIMSLGELVICKREGGIAFDCLIQQSERPRDRLSRLQAY